MKKDLTTSSLNLLRYSSPHQFSRAYVLSYGKKGGPTTLLQAQLSVTPSPRLFPLSHPAFSLPIIVPFDPMHPIQSHPSHHPSNPPINQSISPSPKKPPNHPIIPPFATQTPNLNPNPNSDQTPYPISHINIHLISTYLPDRPTTQKPHIPHAHAHARVNADHLIKNKFSQSQGTPVTPRIDRIKSLFYPTTTQDTPTNQPRIPMR